MRDEYDFSKAVRHPLAGKFKGKYTVIVHYDFSGPDDINEEINADLNQPTTAANNGNPPPTQTSVP